MASRTSSRIPAKRVDPEAASRRRTEKPPVQSSSGFKTSAERRLIAAEETQRELERELSQAKATISRLESDRRWLSEREQQEREERQQLESAWEAEREELTSNNRKLRNTNLELEGNYGDLEDAYNSLKRNSESTIATLTSNLSGAERRNALLQEELEHAQASARERGTTINALREQLEQLEESRANTSISMDNEQWAVVRAELTQLRSTMALNTRLTAEVSKLRARNQNVEILREEKRDLERKLARLEEYKERASRLQGELEAAKMERESWAAFIADPSGEPTSSTPTALTETLRTLRQTNASLSDECGSLRGALEHRSAQLADAERRLASSTSQISALQKSLEELNETNAHRTRRVALLERELASTRGLLATFDAEDAAFPSEASSADHLRMAERVKELEQLLGDYKTAYDELQAKLDEFSGISFGSAKRANGRETEDVDMAVREERFARNQLESDLAQATAKITALEKSIETLQQQLWEAGVATTLGNLTPRDTNILHIQANPAAEHFALRRQELNRLKEENTALLKTITQLEKDLGIPEDDQVVPRKTLDNALTENNELVDTLKQKELRLLRLQQVFKAKAGEFRDATSSIVGWKLMFQSTRVRLTSVFDTTASMVFDSIAKSDVGTMKLISLGDGGDGGPPSTRNLMKHWVHERNSIPCFLAAMTLECYNASIGAQQDEVTMDLTHG